jgi:hypothetical protein
MYKGGGKRRGAKKYKVKVGGLRPPREHFIIINTGSLSEREKYL